MGVDVGALVWGWGWGHWCGGDVVGLTSSLLMLAATVQAEAV